MDNEIDYLRLDIEANVSQNAETKINSITRAIENLNKAIANVSPLDNYNASLRELGKHLANISAKSNIVKNASITDKLETENVKVEDTYQDARIKTEEKLTDKINETTEAYKDQQKQIKKNNKDVKENSSLLGNTRIGKFFKSIERIFGYRIIRAGLSAIVNGFKEGLDNIRTVDKETDMALKKMSQSFTTLKNSFAGLFTEFIKVIEPFITKVADGIANMVNEFSRMKAILAGASTYTKILTSDTEEYQKALNKANEGLLEFDKFSALKEPAKYTGAVEEEVGATDNIKEQEAEYSNFLSIVEQISQLFINIWDVVVEIGKVILPILDSVSGMADGIIRQVNGLLNILKAIVQFLNGDFQGAWHSLANGFANIINGLVNFAVSFANVVLNILQILIDIFANPLIKLFGGKKVELPKITWKMNWQPYADGGMVDRGTAFIAGEAGAEVVATGSRGTGVTNIEQFTTAMYNALSLYGVARSSDLKISGDVYMNTTKVGQLTSKSVITEAERTGLLVKK